MSGIDKNHRIAAASGAARHVVDGPLPAPRMHRFQSQAKSHLGHDHMNLKSIRACTAYIDIDVPTLIWTRGRDFPIARLETRMKCPRCGSRRVLIAFEPPENGATMSGV